MIAQHQGVVRPKISHQPLALGEIDRRTIVVVIADVAVEADRGLRSGNSPHFIAATAMPARVWVWIMQATSGRALWIAPWITKPER